MNLLKDLYTSIPILVAVIAFNKEDAILVAFPGLSEGINVKIEEL